MAEGEVEDCHKIQGWEWEKRIRQEVMHGCELVRQLETKLNCTQGSGLHELLVHFSAEIFATFGKALELSSSDANANSADRRNNSPRSGAPSYTSGNPWIHSAQGCESSKGQMGISRTKRLLPSWVSRISVDIAKAGNDTPPDDGYAWRKYGQKDILGMRHPRNYYRCRHRHDMGCQATKQVQRAEDDPSFFDVTYRGHHTCDDDRRLFSFPITQSGSTTKSDSRIPNTPALTTEFHLQSDTLTELGLLPAQLNSSPTQAPTPRLGADSGNCRLENENLDYFRKNSGPSMFAHSFDFLNNPPHEGNPASSAKKFNGNNRSANIYISPFRRQGSKGSHSIDLLPTRPK